MHVHLETTTKTSQKHIVLFICIYTHNNTYRNIKIIIIVSVNDPPTPLPPPVYLRYIHISSLTIFCEIVQGGFRNKIEDRRY